MTMTTKYRTMQEIVYGTIKERIISGKYAPGQRLITNDLAADLGVSRMPIREALARLEAATGLVSLIPHKGAVVNVVSKEDIVEVFHIRAALEGLAGRLACPNMSPKQIDQMEKINEKMIDLGHTMSEEVFMELNREFHTHIWSATNSPRLLRLLRSLYDASRGYRYMSIKVPGRLDEVAKEHKDVITALRKKDACKVEASMNDHYERTLEWLLRPGNIEFGKKPVAETKKRAGTRKAAR